MEKVEVAVRTTEKHVEGLVRVPLSVVHHPDASYHSAVAKAAAQLESDLSVECGANRAKAKVAKSPQPVGEPHQDQEPDKDSNPIN